MKLFGMVNSIVLFFISILPTEVIADATEACQSHSLNMSFIEKGFKVKDIPSFYLTKGMCLGERELSPLKMDNLLWGAIFGDDFSLQMYASKLLEGDEYHDVKLGLAIHGVLSNSPKENIKINALTALGVYFSFSKAQFFPDELSESEIRELGREYLLAAAESPLGFYALYALSATSENAGGKFLSKGNNVQKEYLGSIQISCDNYIESIKTRSYVEKDRIQSACQD